MRKCVSGERRALGPGVANRVLWGCQSPRLPGGDAAVAEAVGQNAVLLGGETGLHSAMACFSQRPFRFLFPPTGPGRGSDTGAIRTPARSGTVVEAAATPAADWLMLGRGGALGESGPPAVGWSFPPCRL